jgi:uncharacterized Zn-finger protein
MEPAEISEVEPGVESVACDGGGALGHPRVYLTFGDKPYVDCYYCGRRFLKRPDLKPAKAA